MTTFILFSHTSVKETINAIVNWHKFTLADKIVVIDAGNQFFIDDGGIEVRKLEELRIGGDDDIIFVLPKFNAGVPEELKAFTYTKLLRSNSRSFYFAKEVGKSIEIVSWEV